MFQMIGVALVATALTGVGSWFSGKSEGRHIRDLECKAEINVLEQAKIEAERNAVAQREKGRIVADRLAVEVARAKQRTLGLKASMDKKLASAASSNLALSGRVVRLLNEQRAAAAASDSVRGASAASAGTDEAVAAPAPTRPRSAAVEEGARGLSEHATAAELSTLQTRYELMRVQIDGLLEWVAHVTTKQP